VVKSGGVQPYLRVFGTVRLVLDFAPNMPVIGAISVSTLGRPKANFTLQVLGGDVMNLPGAASTFVSTLLPLCFSFQIAFNKTRVAYHESCAVCAVSNRVRRVKPPLLRAGLVDLVDGIINNVLTGLLAWPKRIFVPLQPGVGQEGPKLAGVLYCRLRSASKLPKMDFDSMTYTGWAKGKADPYVQMSVHSDRTVRSAVKKSTLDPEWNEIHQFKIYDTESDSLTFAVYDKDDVFNGEHDKIGTVNMPLSMLEDGKCLAFEAQPIDMTGLKHAKNKKVIASPPTLRFELLYVPFEASDEEIVVPEEWEIPPSGVLKVKLKRATKLPAVGLYTSNPTDP
jgi:Ca2+-dependent lipid-binding protein